MQVVEPKRPRPKPWRGIFLKMQGRFTSAFWMLDTTCRGWCRQAESFCGWPAWMAHKQEKISSSWICMAYLHLVSKLGEHTSYSQRIHLQARVNFDELTWLPAWLQTTPIWLQLHGSVKVWPQFRAMDPLSTPNRANRARIEPKETLRTHTLTVFNPESSVLPEV